MHATQKSRTGFTPLLWALGMREGLTASTKAVLIALASYSDPKGSCYPSMARIADDTRLSERACQKAIPDLEAAGFIRVNRKTGRGHASVYTLTLDHPTDTVKGEPRAPISTDQRVNQMHPLTEEKVHDVHPLAGERVNQVRVKGEPRAPQLSTELPSTAKQQKLRLPKPAKAPPNPRRSDPPIAWVHLADRRPDGSPKTETTEGEDFGRPMVGGAYLDIAAERVCEAAGIRNPHWQGDWKPLLTWLRGGFEIDAIVVAISRVAARPTYTRPHHLSYFDRPVREAATTSATFG